jgi:hypothetical protein
MDAVGFRIYFTPLTGVLFTVPSRYCALSVTTSSWPWTVVGPASHTISRVAWYSRSPPQRRHLVVRDYHPLWCAIPDTSHEMSSTADPLAEGSAGLTTPQTQRLPPWHACGLGISPVRSPLLRAVLYFLRVLRCFSSPGARSSQGGVPIFKGSVGCPIRKRWDQGPAAAPPPYRCCPASFIGSSCRGILQPRIMSCLVSGFLGSTDPCRADSG